MTLECMGIVDLHHHLLPAVDDGAVDLATAIEMARQAVKEGIATVVATPHTFDGTYDVTREAARDAHERLVAALRVDGIDLDVRLAGEVHMHEGIPELLQRDPGVTLDGHGRILLLELPHQGPPPGLHDCLFRLQAGGTTPMIAHPERNLAVRKKPELASDWLQAGALLQLTAGSLTGAFGEPIRACAEQLLRAGAAHVVATDAHSPGKRPPLVQEAFRAVTGLVGRDAAHALFVANPLRVLAGEIPPPLPVAAKPHRGLFARLFR